MAFTFFQGSPSTILPSISNAIGKNDYGLGTGGLQDFPLVNNEFSQLGNLAQAGDALQYSKTLLTLTQGSGPTVAHTATAPPAGAGLIFPNSSPGVLRAYDDPLYTMTAQKYYAIGDVADSIAEYQYTQPPTGPGGIKLYFFNRISEVTIALPSWFQFAPLNDADMTINTGAWTIGGDPLYLPGKDLKGGSSLNGGRTIGAPSITVALADDFVAGQFIKIGSGGTSEICWVTLVVGTTLTVLGGLQQNHNSGETVFACANGFAAKVTIPSGIAGGIPRDWFNCSLDADYQSLVRV